MECSSYERARVCANVCVWLSQSQRLLFVCWLACKYRFLHVFTRHILQYASAFLLGVDCVIPKCKSCWESNITLVLQVNIYSSNFGLLFVCVCVCPFLLCGFCSISAAIKCWNVLKAFISSPAVEQGKMIHLCKCASFATQSKAKPLKMPHYVRKLYLLYNKMVLEIKNA